MDIVIDAVFEDGVLKPAAPLPLEERDRVTLTIRPATSLAQQTAGMIPWSGEISDLERIACDPEFGISSVP